MIICTTLVSIAMVVSWDLPLWLIIPFWLFYTIFEGVLFSSTLYKVGAAACRLGPSSVGTANHRHDSLHDRVHSRATTCGDPVLGLLHGSACKAARASQQW